MFQWKAKSFPFSLVFGALRKERVERDRCQRYFFIF
uniref:Uncharacterized protein n=1 Tax=Rhizophora mucronata TaxID=61149 RepID=A0A2P2QCB6_RHIMU